MPSGDRLRWATLYKLFPKIVQGKILSLINGSNPINNAWISLESALNYLQKHSNSQSV